VLADVAPEDAIAEQRRERGIDGPVVLDRQVRDAAARVEDARLGESRRRAGVQAKAAASAEIGGGLVGRNVEIGEDLAEEMPRARLRIDQTRVAPDPAGPRRRMPR